MPETLSVFGIDVSLYYTFWLLALVVTLLIGVFLRRLYDFSMFQAFLFVVLDFLFGYLLIQLMSFLIGGGQSSGFNFVRIIYVAPIYIYLMSLVFAVPCTRLFDYLSPIGAIFVGVSHIGCIFSGCCHGYPSSWGIVSNTTGEVCFPIQPIEAITNILIGILLLYMAKRGLQKGRLFAWLLLLFGGTRFVFEFFRDNQKLFLNVSELAIHAAIAFLCGAIALIALVAIDKGRSTNEKNKI